MIDIIVNPVSGGGAGLKSLEKIEKFLNDQNIEYKTHLMSRAGDGKLIAEKLCKSGSKKIAAIGGDGTFHEVLNGMDFSKARLGLIPAGRGNDFAKGQKLTFDPVEAIKKVCQGEADDRDYLQVGKLRCLNVCGTGLDIEVLKLTEKFKTKLSYVKSLFKCLLNYKPYTVTVTVNGESKTYSAVMAAFCNGSQFGGGIKLCPPAVSNDGLMNLIVVKEPRCPTICVMPEFVKGFHMKKYYVEHIVCENAVIKCDDSSFIELDGEIYENNVMDCRIVKGGFKTFK